MRRSSVPVAAPHSSPTPAPLSLIPMQAPSNTINQSPPFQEIHAQIRADRNTYRPAPADIAVFRQYVLGNQAEILTTKQKRVLRNLIGRRFCDNVCHSITSEASDRIEFKAWSCPSNIDNQLFLDKLYTQAKIMDRQGGMNYDALRDGNTVLGLAYDPARRRISIYREDWWDGFEGIFIGHNSLDEPVYAVKDWHDTLYSTQWMPANSPSPQLAGFSPYSSPWGGSFTYNPAINTTVVRRLLWYNDRIERWVSHDGGLTFLPYSLPEDNGRWPIPWLKRNGEPLRIPFVQFPNSGHGSGLYGLSEIDGGVLGFNDQLNDLQWCMSSAGRLTGYQMIWATGVSQTKDASGVDVPFEVGPGQVWKASKADARFGTFQPGDLKQLIDLYHLKLSRVAQMTRTPYHLIGGEWPSGDAILRAEKPAVGKANRQVRKFATCWTLLGHKAIEIWNRFSNSLPLLDESIETAEIGTIFASTERRDPLSNSLIVNNLSNFISPEEALRTMDYSDMDAENIILEKDESDLRRLYIMGLAQAHIQSSIAALTPEIGSPPEDISGSPSLDSLDSIPGTPFSGDVPPPPTPSNITKPNQPTGPNAKKDPNSQSKPQGRNASTVRGKSTPGTSSAPTMANLPPIKPVKPKGAIMETRIRREGGRGINS